MSLLDVAVGGYIIVERVVPDREPDYPIHGRAACACCEWWVWLGSRTVTPVTNGEALPLCLACWVDGLNP